MAKDWKKSSIADWGLSFGWRHLSKAILMSKKAAPFTAKIVFVPIKDIKTPPIADPIIPERSSCSPFSTVAEGSSSLETMSVKRESKMPEH